MKAFSNFFKFTTETLLEFTVPKDFSIVQQKQRKEQLRLQTVAGKCRYCKFESKVHFGNPSNWVRHLKQHAEQHSKYKASVKSKKRDRSSSSGFLPEPPNKRSNPPQSQQQTIKDALNPEFQEIQEIQERSFKRKKLKTKKKKKKRWFFLLSTNVE